MLQKMLSTVGWQSKTYAYLSITQIPHLDREGTLKENVLSRFDAKNTFYTKVICRGQYTHNCEVLLRYTVDKHLPRQSC